MSVDRVMVYGSSAAGSIVVARRSARPGTMICFIDPCFALGQVTAPGVRIVAA